VAATGRTSFTPGSQPLDMSWLNTAYNQYVQPWIQSGRGGVGRRFVPGINTPKAPVARPSSSISSGVANSATLNALNARGTQNLFIQDRENAIPALHTAGAGPNGPNPNAIVQGQDGIGEEYRQRMNAYKNQATLARQALQGYDPSKGPLPGAAQEAQDQGMDIWKGLYGGTKMGQPGGAVGTFNPLMQARGDVPSMAELWQGIGGGAPTTGPSNDAIRAAMAKGAAPGGFYPASAGPVPTATSGFDTSFDPAAEAQAQQFRTASQAGVGTESSTALQRAGDFVQNYKLGALNPNNYSLPNFYNTDYSGIFK